MAALNVYKTKIMNNNENAVDTTTTQNSQNGAESIEFSSYQGLLRPGMAQFLVLVDADNNIRAVYAGGVNASYVCNDLEALARTKEFIPVRDAQERIQQKGVLLTHGPTDYDVENNMDSWPTDWAADSVTFFPNLRLNKPYHQERKLIIPVKDLAVPLSIYKNIFEKYADTELSVAVLELGNRSKKVKRANTHSLFSINPDGSKGERLRTYSNTIILDKLMQFVDEEQSQCFPGSGALLDFALAFCAAGITTKSYSKEYLKGYRCWADDAGREELHNMCEYMRQFTRALVHRQGSRGHGRKGHPEFCIGRDKGNAKALNTILTGMSK